MHWWLHHVPTQMDNSQHPYRMPSAIHGLFPGLKNMPPAYFLPCLRQGRPLRVHFYNQRKSQARWLGIFFGCGGRTRYAFLPLAKIKVATSVCTGGRNCPPDSSTAMGSSPRHKNMGYPVRVSHILVPVAGLEPARHRWRWILSPLRLPFHHTGNYQHSIHHLFQNSKGKFLKKKPFLDSFLELGALGPVQLRVDAVVCHQLLMCAAFGNHAVGNGHNPLGGTNCG